MREGRTYLPDLEVIAVVDEDELALILEPIAAEVADLVDEGLGQFALG